MNKQTILTIAQKDMKATFSSKKVWVPMIILAFLLCIVVPACMAYFGIHFDLVGTSSKEIEKPINAFIKDFPNEEIRNNLIALPTLGLKFVYFFLTFMMIPFFLMVAIINSMVTSSNSFVGEKERNTLETLLFAPISIKDLFLGKLVASIIPTLGISFAAFIISFIVVNVITYPHFKVILYFNSTWMILMFWVIPILVLFNIILNVLISSKVKKFQEAQQFGGLLVLPIVGILISQASGMFFLSTLTLFLIGAALLIGNLFLIKLVTKFSNRNTLFQSQIH
ncbi:ABC transporter permease subunit [Bacillus sp. EB106-08-02-XG196]|nr:ABC transporter permease subunit [Bacillus sp. EB106-08-02-XG196]NWQ41313.1 ABC transporter permease subunit [Bacillus sp. EB106-08-02-XG196]